MVRIMPRGSINTPDPEIGLSDEPPFGWHKILTSALRVLELISLKDSGAVEYGFWIRAISSLAEVAEITALLLDIFGFVAREREVVAGAALFVLTGVVEVLTGTFAADSWVSRETDTVTSGLFCVTNVKKKTTPARKTPSAIILKRAARDMLRA